MTSKLKPQTVSPLPPRPGQRRCTYTIEGGQMNTITLHGYFMDYGVKPGPFGGQETSVIIEDARGKLINLLLSDTTLVFIDGVATGNGPLKTDNRPNPVTWLFRKLHLIKKEESNG